MIEYKVETYLDDDEDVRAGVFRSGEEACYEAALSGDVWSDHFDVFDRRTWLYHFGATTQTDGNIYETLRICEVFQL